MSTLEAGLVFVGVLVASYLLVVLVLLGLGRRSQARALARFVPDCAVLFTRLARDPDVARARRAVIVLLAAYLASPIDLVPDFIPVAGLADDAVLVALALRWLMKGSGRERIERHWPGPRASLDAVLRLAGNPAPVPRQG